MADDYSEFKKADEADFSEFKKVEGADLVDKLKMLPKAMAQPFIDTAVGARHAFDKAVRGIGGLLPNYSGFEPPPITPKPQNFPGTLGAVGMDVGMSAGPIGAANKAALMLPRAVRGAGGLATDIAANAGYAAATTPEDREQAAKYGAAGATGGRLLVATLGRLGRPAKTSPITQMMLDEGIPLTPGQAGGKVARMVEGNVANTPFLAGLRRSVREAQAAGQEGAEDFLTDAGRMAANPAAHGISDFEAQEWLKGAEGINKAGNAVVPLNAILTLLHLPTGGATLAATSTLFGTEPGRRFLLGQTSAQEALQQAPQLASEIAQVMRAISTRNLPQEGQ